mmetsp:Transcript_32360/g.59167  ORF Transcript_32360/g.59167 Transcript_32360/m.59167 type:complete len:361 (-) Transcript_32360:94-1176(-)
MSARKAGGKVRSRGCRVLTCSMLAVAVLAGLRASLFTFVGQAEALRAHAARVGLTTRHAQERLQEVQGEELKAIQMGALGGMAPFVLGSQAALAADAAGDAGGLPFIAVGLVVIAAAAAAVLMGGNEDSVDDKAVVKEYFNNEGFNRWNKIYGETEDINPVQKDIRIGHAQTVDRILSWLDKEVDGKEVCDAGCGTGNLTIPLAERGALVSASDISSAMVTEAQRRAEVALENAPGKKGMPNFTASDLEKLDGKYDCVCCVDVLIHYPPEKMDGMVGHLASLSRDRVILSFAPKTWYYLLLKRIGELFPGPAKTTRAYLHEEDLVEAALKRAGYEVKRRSLTAKTFYFSQIFEARPIAAR